MSAALGLRRLQTLRRLAFSLALVPLVIGLAACGSSAPASPTAKPAATSSSSAPKTTASPAAKPGASPSPSPAAAGIQILDATLADATPWVSLRLNGGEPQIVTGWRLEVGDQAVTIPGNAIVQPDETLTLHAGEGRSSDREIFLGPESNALALAAKPGARVRLLDETGVVKAETTVPRF
jgi:hypothetical protein